MRHIGLTICLLLAAFSLSAPDVAAADLDGASAAHPFGAADWRFRRSYFSHHVPAEYYAHDELPRSRSAYRPAYPNTLPGFSVQGGYRFNRIQINSGTSSDTTIIQEGWFFPR